MISAQDSPVFDHEGIHSRLLGGASDYAALAGIRPEWIWQPLSPYVGPNEMWWIKHFHQLNEKGKAGLCFMGSSHPTGGHPVEVRMAALCGALVRNFVDARMRRTYEALADESAATCTVLLLPDFCLGGQRSALPSHQHAVGSLLMDRVAMGRQTVVYAPGDPDLRRVLGEQIGDIVVDSYVGAQL